jgi:hypothetical protein
VRIWVQSVLREVPIIVVGLLGMIVGALRDFVDWLDEWLERLFVELNG